MLRVTEIQGVSHVFNLANGEALRLLARQTKDVKDNLVSDELQRAIDLGIVYAVKVKNTVKEEVNK